MALQCTRQQGSSSSPGNSPPSSRPSTPPGTTNDSQNSGVRSNKPPHCSATALQHQKLPAWVLALQEQEEKEKETLAQPWKAHFKDAEHEDDPNFSEGPDTVMYYDDRLKVCYGEGSMAA